MGISALTVTLELKNFTILTSIRLNFVLLLTQQILIRSNLLVNMANIALLLIANLN